MRKYLIFVVIIFVFYVELGGCSSDETDPYPSIKIPVFSGAYKEKLFKDKEKRIKSIDYYVEIKYPPKQVVAFYENELNKSDFKIKEEERQEWESFIDGTIKGNPKVRQLIASWENKKKGIEALLVLRYKQTDTGWDDILNVKVQLHPLFEKAKLEKFIKELEAAGDETYNGFMNLLDRYRREDGEVDIDKAISENKDNMYLLKYKQILEEIDGR